MYKPKYKGEQMMNHLKVLGHAELTTTGMNEIGETTAGPFRIVEIDHAWGIGILDSDEKLQWVMKGRYNILDFNSVGHHTNVDRIINKLSSECKIGKSKLLDGQIGHVHDVCMESKLDYLILTMSNRERIRMAEKLNCLDE